MISYSEYVEHSPFLGHVLRREDYISKAPGHGMGKKREHMFWWFARGGGLRCAKSIRGELE